MNFKSSILYINASNTYQFEINRENTVVNYCKNQYYSMRPNLEKKNSRKQDSLRTNHWWL